MRYDNGNDWVEITGVADLPMRELVKLDGINMAVAHELAVSLTPDAHFVDKYGNVVDWREDVLGLSVQQLTWWKKSIWRAAREEKVDPEA